jgi:DMSO/TMAO reductase YedYZ molybdopterin-dependent catalytic subunit
MDIALPPGQVALDEFPRFGTHFHRSPPPVPADPGIEIRGAVTEPFLVSQTELASLPRSEISADFHCVAGWSVTDLRWEGVAFETFYRRIIEPSLRPGAQVTHVVFGGLDGFQSALAIEDALAEDVLIAERLGGRPLDADHGAPARLVSPSQYGYMSTKHLCEIEVHTEEPTDLRAATPFAQAVLRALVVRHPRARVWAEERHSFLPNWSIRRFYRLITPPIAALSKRGSDE